MLHEIVVVVTFQVVVEKAPKSSIQDIDKRKFLVPSDLTGTHLCKIHKTHLLASKMVRNLAMEIWL